MPAKTYVELAIEEMQAQLDSLPAKIEGLHDIASVNLHSDTKDSVISTTQYYEKRKGLLETAIVQCQNLLDNGYPGLPVMEIPQDQFLDLQENQASIDAAVALFAPEKAASLGVTFGAPEPK